MGYNSTFSGSLHPNKPIPPEVVQRINRADLDVCVAGKDTDCHGEPGDIVPVCYEMHGYNWCKDTYKVQQLLSCYGITLSGDIDRDGEERDDFERMEVRKGHIYMRTGVVTYGKREELTAACITRYGIRVTLSGDKVPQHWVECEVLDTKFRLVPGTVKPPVQAYRYSTKEQAEREIARNREKGCKYQIVKLEESL